MPSDETTPPDAQGPGMRIGRAPVRLEVDSFALVQVGGRTDREDLDELLDPVLLARFEAVIAREEVG